MELVKNRKDQKQGVNGREKKEGKTYRKKFGSLGLAQKQLGKSKGKEEGGGITWGKEGGKRKEKRVQRKMKEKVNYKEKPKK